MLEGIGLEGTLLTLPSLHTSLPQPPSAELFHYDSTNAVNWGMRGKVLRGWGWQRGETPWLWGTGGLPSPLRAAPENGVWARGGRWGGGRVSLQLRGGMLAAEGALANVSFVFFCPHRVQGTMALLWGVTATQR